MRTRALGDSGLDVSEIGLGAMWLSIYDRPDEAHSVRLVHAALDAGMTLIDTADVYCHGHWDIGHNERVVARALREWSGDRDGIVVATKGGLERPDGEWRSNGHPAHLRWACDQSLAALGVDVIDLYQLHAPDDRYPLEDTVGALAELRQAGKIRHVGLSNVSVEQIDLARALVPISSVQNRCSIIDRQPWTDGVLAHCEALGIAFLPYSPVGGGHGKARIAEDPTLNAISARYDASPFEVALRWLLAMSPMTIPIPGARRIESALSSARAAELPLTPEDLAELSAAFPT